MPLLRDIVCCENLSLATEGSGHKCEEIVSVQRGLGGRSTYQVPEPWRGDIQRAPLLFVSSNPSIDLFDDAPWSCDSIETITAYYDRDVITEHFPKATLRYGPGRKLLSREVPFWKSVDKLAAELFGCNVAHGKDYAITEVVHCKSRGQYGVEKALATCSKKFLPSVLEYSKWKVLVVLGEYAEVAVRETLLQPEARPVIYLAHPSAWARINDVNTNPKEPKLIVTEQSGKSTNVKNVRKAKTVEAAISMGQVSSELITTIRSTLNVFRQNRTPVR